MAAFNRVTLDTLDIKQFHKTGDINDTFPARYVLIVGEEDLYDIQKITLQQRKLINKYQQDVTPQYFLFPVLSLSTCFGHVPCPSSGDQLD
jgi:hypothetical protein